MAEIKFVSPRDLTVPADMNLTRTYIYDATHVETKDGRIERIESTWGIGPDRALAKPSEGGFGCVTVSGRRIPMMKAWSYWKEKREEV